MPLALAAQGNRHLRLRLLYLLRFDVIDIDAKKPALISLASCLIYQLRLCGVCYEMLV
jgi:hypothetical protein